MPSWTSTWHTVINKLTLFVRHLHHSLMNYFISHISNDDGSEKVAKKINLRSFKLYRVYLDPLNMSNVGDFPGVEFLRVLLRFKKTKENLSSYVHVLYKTSNWEISRRSRAVDVKEIH